MNKPVITSVAEASTAASIYAELRVPTLRKNMDMSPAGEEYILLEISRAFLAGHANGLMATLHDEAP